MNGYERVKRAIEFGVPDRLPMEFTSLGISDTHYIRWNQISVGDKRMSEAVDDWGCVWHRTAVANMGQVKGHPLEDWSYAADFAWPDPDDARFYEGMDRWFSGSEGKYVITEIFMLLFERLQALRGFENVLTDLYLERENLEELADRIVAFDIAVIGNIARRFPGRIHALKFTDDWGTELATIISPALWNDFFRPRYQKIFDAAKSAGWDIWMHSCGKIDAIVEDLIQTGVNVLNLQQPRVFDIRLFGERFAGRVCFSSLCDIQKTLQSGDAREIEEEAKLLMQCWATERGGFILSDYGDGEAIGVPDSKKRLMFEAFAANDRWAKQ